MDLNFLIRGIINGSDCLTVEERLLENEYEDVVVYSNSSYDNALIGVSTDGQVIYDYDLMVEWLINNENMTYEEAVDYIEYNVIVTNNDNKYPIVMHKLLF